MIERKAIAHQIFMLKVENAANGIIERRFLSRIKEAASPKYHNKESVELSESTHAAYPFMLKAAVAVSDNTREAGIMFETAGNGDLEWGGNSRGVPKKHEEVAS